ncbi:MAG: glycosyltransferase family 39 protein, partial [Parvularculaceae bacterium]
GGVDGAPPLSIVLSAIGVDGRVYPQYPLGFAIIAAPFYAAFGIYGLFLLEAVSGLVAIFLTQEIARRLFGDARLASFAAALFAGATFFSTYAFSIWPHMLTLAMLLGAALSAIMAVDKQRLHGLSLSGALLAAAITVRVDSIIFFAAIFLWLRFFAMPERRVAVLYFVAGAVPVIAIATLFNFIKFGIASPISYGDKSGYETLDGYLPLAIAAASMTLFLTLFKVTGRAEHVIKTARKLSPSFYLAIALALLILPPSARLLHHFWTLLFDIQAYDGDYHHDVLIKGAGGFLTTFGLPKKAFFESMPFFAISILPMIAFLRGKNVRAVSLCLLFSAAPIVFFSLKQWHGGHSFNMRFFLPAVPFLSMLAAKALLELRGEKRLALCDGILIAAGAIGLLFFQIMMVRAAPELSIAAVTLPQLFLAIAIFAGVASHAIRPAPRRTGALAGLCLIAIGASATSSFGDYELTRKTRHYAGIAGAHFAKVLPADSLIISLAEMQLIPAMMNGASLYHPEITKPDELIRLVAAFDRAGRCVYVKKGEIADFVAAATGAEFISAAAYAPADLDWFDTLAPARPGCTFP